MKRDGFLQTPITSDSESEGTPVARNSSAASRAYTLAETPERRLLTTAFEAWRYARVSSGLYFFLLHNLALHNSLVSFAGARSVAADMVSTPPLCPVPEAAALMLGIVFVSHATCVEEWTPFEQGCSWLEQG
jgi:hypothetical protein